MLENVSEDGVSILNLISLLGLFVMLGFAWLMSSHKTRVNWKLVAMGLGLQLLLAAILFQSQYWTFGGLFPEGILFAGVEFFFREITLYVESGAGFVFRANGIVEGNPTDPMTLVKTFAFGVLPTVIFFAALMSILYHIGIMTRVIRCMAWIMQKTLGTSGAESLAAAANVLVGHTEAPLVVRPYIATMTRSELNALMVGGFATITGSLMAIFVAQGISAGHILTACIISAPAALVIAKIMQPEIDEPETLGHVDAKTEKTATNVIEAAAVGASDGVKLALNIAGMLIAFLALIALVDSLLIGLGNLVEYAVNPFLEAEGKVDFEWSLNNLFAIAFYPLAMIMGIETGDCSIAGQLLGKKMVVNEFVAYLDLGTIINEMSEKGASAPEAISQRTEIILTYALAGFSNFGAIGIQLGGIGPLAPNRRSDLAQLGFRAMLGGMLACCMTACIAGMMYGLVQ
ncbi:MAG: NupC/NupG family nucleoside CNT transporter [Mariniblastus sp.]|nr:NupC/NupG family nucleoside CNT transporter [Mariniblastus sp.]